MTTQKKLFIALDHYEYMNENFIDDEARNVPFVCNHFKSLSVHHVPIRSLSRMYLSVDEGIKQHVQLAAFGRRQKTFNQSQLLLCSINLSGFLCSANDAIRRIFNGVTLMSMSNDVPIKPFHVRHSISSTAGREDAVHWQNTFMKCRFCKIGPAIDDIYEHLRNIYQPLIDEL